MNNNPFKVTSAQITEIIQESPHIKTLRLDIAEEEKFHFATGQFAEVTVPDKGEAPFTPSSSMYNKDHIDFTVMKTGFVTDHIHQLKPGKKVGLRGPFGSKYPLEEWKGKDILIMGGGVGMAPTRSLLLSLLDRREDYNKITYLVGARTPKDMIYKDEVRQWNEYDNVRIIRGVDEVPEGQDWDEEVGLITELIEKIKIEPENNPAVVCGPPVMMKFSTLELIDHGFKEDNIYLSMEKKMYCGHGQCRHCLIGNHYTCKDGPVFTYDKIKNEENIWK